MDGASSLAASCSLEELEAQITALASQLPRISAGSC